MVTLLSFVSTFFLLTYCINSLLLAIMYVWWREIMRTPQSYINTWTYFLHWFCVRKLISFLCGCYLHLANQNIEYRVYRDGPIWITILVVVRHYSLFSHHACIKSVCYLCWSCIFQELLNNVLNFSFKRVFGTSMPASEESSALEPEATTSSGKHYT